MLGDPQHIQHLSDTYRNTAGKLTELAGRLESKVRQARFEGPAADRWKTLMQARIGELHRASADCLTASRRLHDAAESLKRELKLLHRLEQGVRDAFSRFDPLLGLAPPWLGLRWHPGFLPSPGDPEWKAIAKHLGVFR